MASETDFNVEASLICDKNGKWHPPDSETSSQTSTTTGTRR